MSLYSVGMKSPPNKTSLIKTIITFYVTLLFETNLDPDHGSSSDQDLSQDANICCLMTQNIKHTFIYHELSLYLKVDPDMDH